MNPHDAKVLAFELMRQHGLAGWRFRFDHARRRFGCCRYGSKEITLSRPLVLLNEADQVKDTLLHEIAHALTPGDGHGPKWRAACQRIGAKARRCYGDEEVQSPARKPAPYRFGCGTCNWWVDRRRVTRRRFLCAKCRDELTYLDKASGRSFRVGRSGAWPVA